MIRRTFALLLLPMVLLMTGAAWADESIGVFVNTNTNCLQFIDPVTQSVSRAFLRGQLGSLSSELLDVVITSDGKTAIVSNYSDSKLFFVDISGGFHETPVLLGSTTTPISPLDLALTPNNKYVLVTDGSNVGKVVVVRVSTRRVVSVLNAPGTYPVSVVIAPDGTVFTVDYAGRAIRAYTLSTVGTLTLKKKTSIGYAPLNVVISPDGKTIIVVCHQGILSFYRYGTTLSPGATIPLTNRPGQSCVFSKDGTKAYYLTSGSSTGTVVHVLNVPGPGMIRDSKKDIRILPKRGTYNLFGVDTIAIDPSGDYLYVANPSLSYGVSEISIVDLTTNTQVNTLQAQGIPTGIAFAPLLLDDAPSTVLAMARRPTGAR